MHYLHGIKRDGAKKLVATFSSEQQLRAYVRWATLENHGEQSGKFEQGSALASCVAWEETTSPPEATDGDDVLHNPTPSML